MFIHPNHFAVINNSIITSNILEWLSIVYLLHFIIYT